MIHVFGTEKFLSNVKDAVNSCIRMMNELHEKENGGNRLIGTEWNFMIDRERGNIKVILEIRGELVVTVLTKKELESDATNSSIHEKLMDLAAKNLC